MATHSSVLAWRIPWTETPGGLWSIGSQRVGNNKQLSTHASLGDTQVTKGCQYFLLLKHITTHPRQRSQAHYLPLRTASYILVHGGE